MQAQVHLGENGAINVDEEAYNGDDGQTESFQTLVKGMNNIPIIFGVCSFFFCA